MKLEDTMTDIEIGQHVTGMNDHGDIVEGIMYEELYEAGPNGGVTVTIAIAVNSHDTAYLGPEQILSVQ